MAAETVTMDPVTLMQDELSKVGQLLSDSAAAAQQLHAPESAPPPPPGVDERQFYDEFWQKRREDKPFATRGFQNSEESAGSSEERLKKTTDTMMKHVEQIFRLIESYKLDQTEEEQLKELERLEEENERAGVELEEAVSRANEFLGRVAGLQRKVAAGALGF